MKFCSLENLAYFKTKLTAVYTSMFVAKVDGKGLSTNDYTTADKSKLAGIADSAQVNVIETVKVNGSSLTPSGKEVNIDLSTYAKVSDLSTVYKYKGTVDTYSALPADASVGDVYNITASDDAHGVKAGDNLAWDGTAWDNLSGVVDLTGYVEKDGNKVLSTNDFTDTYKTKLDGIAEGANNYTLTAATSSTLGGVKIGANITNTDGSISVSHDDVVNALGYTPTDPSTVDGVEPLTIAEIDGIFAA